MTVRATKKLKMRPMWRGEIHQHGMMVACVEHTDPKTVRRELRHYAAQYAADGPVVVVGPKLIGGV